MFIIGIVHLLYEVLRYCPVCVQRLRNQYGNVSQKDVYSRTAGVQNAVSHTVLRYVWFTAMRIDGIVHLVYEVPRDLPICIQRLCGHP